VPQRQASPALASPGNRRRAAPGSARRDPALLASALAFAAAAGLGSAAAIRDQLPGRPLGVSVPLSVPAGLLAGWGAGTAAPWPMPVTAVIAAVRAQRASGQGREDVLCAVLGAGCIIGTAVEPVTWRWRSLSLLTRVAITANLALSAALVAISLRHLAHRRACSAAR
jgi:hypothetical protein